MQSYLQHLTSKHIGYEKSIRQLFFKYGSNTSMILQIARQRKMEKTVSLDQALHFAEIKYAIENEMVHSLSDFCIRRTGMLYFNPIKLMEMLAELGEYMQEILGWDEQKLIGEINLVRLAYRTAIDFGD
jgi:glycerol-3-phosphate dehydrogenase